MGTSKHVVILLTLALGGILVAGQDKPGASAPASQRRISNTRVASCIVRVTVDPAIMFLDQGSIESLLQSSGVVFKAGREVLSLTKPEDFARPLITVEWLNLSAAPMPPGARPSRQTEMNGYDYEMMRQMEQVYGHDYMTQMMGPSGEGKKDGAKEGRTGESSQRDGVSGPSRRGRSENAPRERGGSMGGMGMMGGMSGGMGGFGGGMEGGMMGGYGGGGGMGFYGSPTASQQNAGGQRTATVKLQVNLPEDVPPLADEFLRAVVRNLQDSLLQAYDVYSTDLQGWLNNARGQHREMEVALEGAASDASEMTQKVKEQLDTIVDLSALDAQMPLNDAVQLLKKSVVPSLNIVVLWNSLSAPYSPVEPTTPINMEGMTQVRLRTALDILVKGLPNRAGRAGPAWRIKDNVIVIGTALALAEPRESAARPKVEADAVNLAGQRSELTRKVQALELDLAGIDARREAIASQTAGVRQRVSEKLSTDPAIREFEKLSQVYSSSSGSPEEREKAFRAKIELANRREELSKQAGGSQLEEFNKELSRMAIDKAEKEAQLQIVRKQLDEVQRQLAQALTFDPEAARLRLAQESLDIIARRVADLETRVANLQPPTVIMIGAN